MTDDGWQSTDASAIAGTLNYAAGIEGGVAGDPVVKAFHRGMKELANLKPVAVLTPTVERLPDGAKA